MVNQRVSPGAVFSVPLGPGAYGAGQILENDMAFFEVVGVEPPDPAVAVHSPVALRAMVHHSAITTGRWLKLGKAPIANQLSKPLLLYKVGAFGGKGSGFYRLGGEQRPIASREELQGLEPSVVFDAQSIEERLRKHIEGSPLDYVRGDDLWHPLYGWAGHDPTGKCKALLEAMTRDPAERAEGGMRTGEKAANATPALNQREPTRDAKRRSRKQPPPK